MADLASDYVPAPTLAELNRELVSGLDGWPRLEHCPVCESPRVRRLATLRELPYDRCRDCGFTFTNPSPPPDVCDAFYDSGFYSNYRILEDRRAETDPYYSASMYREPGALARLAIAGRPRSVLDFGCGTGAFLALLRDEFAVPEVVGLEISAIARATARARHGLEVCSEPAQLPHDSYELVSLIEVIEHVPDPAGLLATIAGLVAPGGRLLVTTPAVDSLAGRWLPSQCLHYTAPSHVSLFTTDAIERLLHRFGFSPLRLETDREWGFARKLALAPLYRPDFQSPTDDSFTGDVCFRPTGLGSRRGRIPTDRPVLGRHTERLASLGDRMIARLAPRPDHLYVLAERVG